MMMTAQDDQRRSWFAVEFEADSRQEDLASWLMISRGAKGCEVKPAEGSTVILHAIFDPADLPNGNLDRLKASLEEYGLSMCLHSLRVQTVLEEDWLAQWKQGYEPFPVGDKFIICPPWLREELTPQQVDSRHLIVVEPGMAYGTGLHATTRYCLRALEKHATGPAVLDVGTGSGILAIAAALICPRSTITAIDVDPVAISVARENIELNNVLQQVRLLTGSTEIVAGSVYQTVLSNLTCEDIVALLPDYLKLTGPGSIIICAGILTEKLPLLERALQGQPLSIIDREVDDQWVGLVLQRESGAA